MMDRLLDLGSGEELVIILRSVVLVATMGVVMLAVLMGMTMMMGIKMRSWEWYTISYMMWEPRDGR